MNTANAHAGHGEAHRAEALQQEVHVELLRLAHKLGGGEQDGQQLHGVEGAGGARAVVASVGPGRFKTPGLL